MFDTITVPEVRAVNQQIEMISVCATDGTLTPLRFRLEDEAHCLQTVPILRTESSKSIQYAGVDAIQYLCRVTMEGRERLLELRYTVRTHRWSLFRVVY